MSFRKGSGGREGRCALVAGTICCQVLRAVAVCAVCTDISMSPASQTPSHAAYRTVLDSMVCFTMPPKWSQDLVQAARPTSPARPGEGKSDLADFQVFERSLVAHAG
jgi:hypothetical protein